MDTTARNTLIKGGRLDTSLPPEQILLTRKEAAKFLGLKTNTLAVWKSAKRYDLPMIKVGGLTKYRLSDLQNFLDQNECKMTSGGNDVY